MPEMGVIERARLEFLVDGIFAIAMTILVLDLRVPEQVGGEDVTSLGRALLESLPTYGSYLLSFTVLGILWLRQNKLYRYFPRITVPVFALYLVQLAAAATFPFCAALLGRHLANPLALSIYAGCIAVYNWAAFGSLALTARHDHPQRDAEGFARQWKRQRRSALVVTLVFASAVARALLERR